MRLPGVYTGVMRARAAAVVVGLMAAAISMPPSRAMSFPQGRLVFAVHADRKAEARNGIYSIRPDGSSKIRLIGGNVTAPEFSPGHDYVAYTRSTSEGTYLHVMRDDGSDDHVLARASAVLLAMGALATAGLLMDHSSRSRASPTTVSPPTSSWPHQTARPSAT